MNRFYIIFKLMTTLKLKSCDRYNGLVDIRYRIQYQPPADWILVCRNCWQNLNQENPYYRDGGTWKAKRK